MQESDSGDQGCPHVYLRPERARYVPDLYVRFRRTKDCWLPKLRPVRNRLFRFDGARFRLESRRHDDTERRKKRRLVLNGAKMWITNGSRADVAVVWAKIERRGSRISRRKRNKRIYRPRKERQILFVHRRRGNLFFRIASSRKEIYFRKRRPEISAHVSESGAIRNCLGRYRFGDGVLRCRDQLRKSADQFGKPIASFQLTQEKLVYMLTEITKAQLLVSSSVV